MRSTILVASESGVITGVLALSRVCQKAGLTRESLIGTRVWEVPTADRFQKLIRHHFAECLLTEADQQFELPVQVNGRNALYQVSYIRASAPGVVLINSQAVDDGNLSAEELRVVRMLVNDVPLKDIAAKCRVSSSTIHTRLDRIRRKLGVKTTHGIVSAVHTRGIG